MWSKKQTAITAVVVGFTFGSAFAQDQIKFSGLFYMDYEYVATSPDSAQDGAHGFRYRRLYLTADYEISEQFSGRARLEAQTSRIAEGRPFTFVKDLWLKWKGFPGDGHDLIFGVQSPPSFVISEKKWGYRSLAQTIMDRNGTVSSRDFGVQLQGTFSKDGPLGYAIMFGNDSSVLGETNKSKRLYGQLSWMPSDRITVTAGTDYAAGPERDALNANAFFAYDAQSFRVGVESFFRSFDFKTESEDLPRLGVSLWAVVATSKKTELVARVDRVERESSDRELAETYGLAGFAFYPHEHVRFIPNVWISDFENRDPVVAGRLTIHADF